jgi:hypothetical protein
MQRILNIFISTLMLTIAFGETARAQTTTGTVPTIKLPTTTPSDGRGLLGAGQGLSRGGPTAGGTAAMLAVGAATGSLSGTTTSSSTVSTGSAGGR